MSEVVPPYDSDAPWVKRYRQDIKAYDQGQVTFGSLEGYIAARLLGTAIERTGADPTTDKVIAALEGMRDLDVGVGVPISFSPSDHQASHKVWGMRIDSGGAFSLQWTWTRQGGVQIDH